MLMFDRLSFDFVEAAMSAKRAEHFPNADRASGIVRDDVGASARPEEQENTRPDFSALQAMPLPRQLRANSIAWSLPLTGGLRHQAERISNDAHACHGTFRLATQCSGKHGQGDSHLGPRGTVENDPRWPRLRKFAAPNTRLE
jgi:hypothetical protein